MHFEIREEITYNDILTILQHKKKLVLGDDAIDKIKSCRKYLDAKMKNPDAVFYGINTGFGSLCNTRVSSEELESLQENLILSHACGAGDFVPDEIIRLMLLLKIQSLSYGFSGVQLETVQRLVDFFNLDILPVVYEQGSLGASGDLAPLAHLCLPIIGKGKVWSHQDGKRVMLDASVLREIYHLEPLKLKSKEGLALINGTQFMLAYAIWCQIESNKLSECADKIASVSLDAFDCRMEPFDHKLHIIRKHAGQLKTANNILHHLKDSSISLRHKEHVQDPYAFRCIPQVHGATKDALNHTASIFIDEANSVTDNPNVFPDDDQIISGGNFHGQPLAINLDYLAIAIAELGSISERRTYQLISGLRGLPPFLAKDPGLHSGMMIPQYTAAGIVSQNKQLCTPASVDSIVSSNGQEDHVSMGANAATKCRRVVQNVKTILAIELLNAAQALEFRRPDKSSHFVENLITSYRKVISFNEADRFLHDDIMKSIEFVETMNDLH